jgi:hypothetical protein
MVQIEEIGVGQVFSLWRIVQVDSLLTYHGLVFFLKAQIVARLGKWFRTDIF